MKATGGIDIGIALLRPFLCLGVVCCHFWSSAPSFAWHFVLPCCAPLFFLISFYLFTERFTHLDWQFVRKRLFRLYFPLISWAVIYYLAINLSHLLVKTEDVLSLKDLWVQCVTGHRYNEPMWFQFDLIIVTVLFFIVVIACKNKRRVLNWLFCGFSVLAFFMQYTSLNYQLFSPLDYSLRYPLGRISEMLPYAFAGMVLPFVVKIEKWKQALLIGFLLVFSCVLYLFHDAPRGFGYQGLRFLFLSISVFWVVKFIRFDRMADGMKKAVLLFSRYTLGIYCAHLLLERCVRFSLTYMSWDFLCGSLLYCLIIYFFCFFVFFIIDKLVGNKYLKMVFK